MHLERPLDRGRFVSYLARSPQAAAQAEWCQS